MCEGGGRRGIWAFSLSFALFYNDIKLPWKKSLFKKGSKIFVPKNL